MKIRLKSIGQSLAVLAIGFVLTACTGVVSTQVSTFRSAQLSPNNGSVFVLPSNSALKPSLEFAFYRERSELALSALGYSIAKNIDSADNLAYLDFGVDQVEVDDHQLPVGYIAQGYRPYNSRVGVVVVDDGKETQFLRRVKLVLARNDVEQTHFYEVSGKSVGRCGVLSVVFDEMLEAMLQNYPAANASVKNIRVSGDTACR